MEKNYVVQWEFYWNPFSMFWKCKPGLCLRIKHLLSLDANLLDYLLKQSLSKKHRFDILIYKINHDYQNIYFWHLNIFANYKNDFSCTSQKHTDNSTKYQFHGSGKALLFSSDELLPYKSTDLYELQSQFLHSVKKMWSRALFLMMVQFAF